MAPILLLTSEEHLELSVLFAESFFSRQSLAVSEGGMPLCLVGQQHYSGELDLPEGLASCAHPCG